jgi:phosphatidylserine/phosphatidylglycerophosphate/cardiolipin synthase-like enzyme
VSVREDIDNYNEPNEEFVITAPSEISAHLAFKLGARTTLGVLIELISESKQELIIASPFIQASKELEDPIIYEALDLAILRDVNVNIFTTGAGIKLISSDPIFKGRKNIKYFRPEANLDNDSRLGSHAKFCISDGKKAYLGSANLTWPGLYGNLEMGILLTGDLAKKVKTFWDLILDEDLVIEVNEFR